MSEDSGPPPSTQKQLDYIRLLEQRAQLAKRLRAQKAKQLADKDVQSEAFSTHFSGANAGPARGSTAAAAPEAEPRRRGGWGKEPSSVILGKAGPVKVAASWARAEGGGAPAAPGAAADAGARDDGSEDYGDDDFEDYDQRASVEGPLPGVSVAADDGSDDIADDVVFDDSSPSPRVSRTASSGAGGRGAGK